MDINAQSDVKKSMQIEIRTLLSYQFYLYKAQSYIFLKDYQAFHEFSMSEVGFNQFWLPHKRKTVDK